MQTAAQEAFKVGYLRKLAEHGVTPKMADAYLQMSKQALETTTALLAAGLVPVLGGMLTGNMHSSLTRESPSKLKSIMASQRINKLREQSAKLRYQIARMRESKELNTGPRSVEEIFSVPV